MIDIRAKPSCPSLTMCTDSNVLTPNVWLSQQHVISYVNSHTDSWSQLRLTSPLPNGTAKGLIRLAHCLISSFLLKQAYKQFEVKLKYMAMTGTKCLWITIIGLSWSREVNSCIFTWVRDVRAAIFPVAAGTHPPTDPAVPPAAANTPLSGQSGSSHPVNTNSI